jgi:hypothetical protein
MKLALIAVVLSAIALTVSVGLPMYSLLTTRIEEGSPSFCLSIPSFTLFRTFTEIGTRNNGTADAHNVRVELYFGYEWHNMPVVTHSADQFIPELAKNESTMIYFQIGGYILNATSIGQVPLSAYRAEVYSYCKELGNASVWFHFDSILSH